MQSNTSLHNSFFTSDDDNLFAAGGKVYFYDNASRSTLKAVYRDKELTIPFTNPVILSAVGSMPAFYMPDNEVYYIRVLDQYDTMLEEIEGYSSQSTSGKIFNSSTANNLIVNPQFDYQVGFETDQEGYLKDTISLIGYGWTFQQDDLDLENIIIEYEDISTLALEDTPSKALRVTSKSSSIDEDAKDLIAEKISSVGAYDGEKMTISLLARDNTNSSDKIEVYLLKNYGDSSTTDQNKLKVATFTLTSSFAKYTATFDVVKDATAILENNNFLTIFIRYPLKKTCDISITNVFLVHGDEPTNNYPQDSDSIEKAKAISSIFNNIEVSNTNAFNELVIGSTAQKAGISLHSYTGMICLLATGGKIPYNMMPCDGRTLKVNEEGIKGIPNRRLYDVIGNIFGSEGDIFAKATSGTALTISSEEGREKTAFGTGTLSSKITIQDQKKGNDLGLTAVFNGTDTIAVTFIDNFINTNDFESATYVGFSIYSRNIIESINKQTPTGSVPAKCDIVFKTSNIVLYRTRKDYEHDYSLDYTSCLGWNSPTSNPNRWSMNPNEGGSPYYTLSFTVDGVASTVVPFGTVKSIYDMNSTKTLVDNLTGLTAFINNGFIKLITFSALPAAGEYFLYSSTATDYYAWYTIDGSGTDPAISGKTGIKVELLSTSNIQDVINLTTAAINTFAFKIPKATDLPALPTTPKIGWYIKT